MVLPLIAAAAIPLLAGGYAGRQGIDRYFQNAERERAGADFASAIEAARGGLGYEEPRPSADFVGPLPEAQGVNSEQLGIELATRGYPAGIDILTSGQRGDLDFQRDVQLAQMGNQAAMERLQFSQSQQNQRWAIEQLLSGRAAPRTVDVAGLGPVEISPLAVGSTEWNKLAREGQALQGMGQDISQITQFLAQEGTEFGGGRDLARMRALAARLRISVNRLSGLGALDEGTMEILNDIIPEPDRITPDFLAGESGTAEALAEWYNNLVDRYQAVGQWQAALPEIGRLPTRYEVPPGLRPETPEEAAAAQEGAAPAKTRRGRQPRGPVQRRNLVDEMLNLSP